MQPTVRQLQAIEHKGRNLQLIACAGSGKTEVVARRVVELLKPPPGRALLPRNIIAFTFTDKAAAELKERIITRTREAFGQVTGLAEMFVGTIHAFCLDVLKTEAAQFLKYGILNEVQQALFVDRHSKKSGLTTSTDLRGVSLRRYVDTPHYIDALSILREADLDDANLAGCSVRLGLELYRNLLNEQRYLDYSAILEEAVDIMANDADIRARLAERVRYVIVDEYQDVNPAQEAIVWLLHDLKAQVCVVGDDDQTIYQWRGSDVQNIVTFGQRYPAVDAIPLEENFRSSEGIVETARQFIEKVPAALRLPKAMKPTNAQAYEPGDLVALSFNNPDEEALYIAETAKALRGVAVREDDQQRGISWSDMAVLLRSVKRNGEPITRALEAFGIPFIVIGMTNLFGAAEAEAARQLFYFVAGRPGVDEQAVEQAWMGARLGLDLAQLRSAIASVAKAKASLAEPDQKRWGLYSIQRTFLTFLEEAEIREERIPDGRGEIVFYNLGKFSQLISDFETIHYHSQPVEKYGSFANFLQYRAEDAYPEGWQDNQYANPDAVRIMTIHQAKGMQWPVVFIPALLRNRFPAKGSGGRTVWHLLPRDGVKGQARFEGTLEDERRLFYVAMTRSQKFLHLTWAPIPGNQLFQKASVFWDDVLASKWVKRKRVDYTKRARLAPTPRAGVANVVFSFSDLKYYFECPYQFKLRILYGFNVPIHEALGYGKSLHDALAEVHAKAIRGAITDADGVPQLIQTHLHTPYAYPALRAQLEMAAARVLRDYLQDNRDLFDKIEFSEKQIEISLGDGVTVTGRIDLVRRIDTGETTIVDLKSRDRVQPEEVTEVQLHVYALGYQDLTGRRPDYVEVYELDERKRKARSVDDDFIADVKVEVQRAAEALRGSTLPARPVEKKCSACDYRKMCTDGCATISKG